MGCQREGRRGTTSSCPPVDWLMLSIVLGSGLMSGSPHGLSTLQGVKGASVMRRMPDLVRELKEEDKPMEQPLRESTVMATEKTQILSWGSSSLVPVRALVKL